MRDDKSLGSDVFEKIPNKYMAVVVSSKRAKALNDGARPLVKIPQAKPTTMAMEEIAAGLVTPTDEKQEVAAVEAEEKGLLPAPGDLPVIEDEDKDADKDKNEEE